MYYQFARPVRQLAAKRTVFSIYNTPIIGHRLFDGIGKNYALEKQAVQNGLRLSLIDHFIANSWAFVDGLRDIGVDRKEITLIPFGIDIDIFTPLEEKHSNKGTVDILCTSRFVKRKGISYLLTSLDYLPDYYRLHLTGSGTVHDSETHQALTQQAQKYGNRVCLVANRTNLRDLVKLYQEADVFAMPSEYEGFGLSAMEAMACGTPVVTTDVQGFQEFVQDGETGILVEYGSPCQLAQAIRRLAEDETLRSSITANALAVARRTYSFNSMIKGYADFYSGFGGTD